MLDKFSWKNRAYLFHTKKYEHYFMEYSAAPPIYDTSLIESTIESGHIHVMVQEKIECFGLTNESVKQRI